MEAKRRTLFQQLRHRNVSSIDDLKEKLRKLYVRDLKAKRDRVLDGRRDGAGARSEDEEPDELEELRLYRQMCRRFFGPAADPWNDNEEEEELLARIWEEMNGEVEPPDEAIRDVLDDTEERVVCPVCLRLPLVRDHFGRASCACGWALPLPAGLNLQDLEALVSTAVDLHGAACEATPALEVRGRHRLVCACRHCLAEHVILEDATRPDVEVMESS